VPCSRYTTVAELLNDRELQARETFVEVEDGSGTFIVPRQPFRFSNSAVTVSRHVSDVSADCEAILSHILGLSPEAINDLKTAQVIPS
jgi:crotonobetainyl-CoA:carnitine CoA-transferase CaiB-like acyl-CoA transferase